MSYFRLTVKEVARAMGVDASTIRRWYSEFRIPKPHPQDQYTDPYYLEDEVIIIEEYGRRYLGTGRYKQNWWLDENNAHGDAAPGPSDPGG